MTYPKKWLDSLERPLFPRTSLEERDEMKHMVLDALREVGALKEPPKPREWRICIHCGCGGRPGVFIDPLCNKSMSVRHDFVTVREVED